MHLPVSISLTFACFRLVSVQDKSWLACTSVGAWQVGARARAQLGRQGTLVDVDAAALVSGQGVPFAACALEWAVGVDALVFAGVGRLALVDVHTGLKDVWDEGEAGAALAAEGAGRVAADGVVGADLAKGTLVDIYWIKFVLNRQTCHFFFVTDIILWLINKRKIFLTHF